MSLDNMKYCTICTARSEVFISVNTNISSTMWHPFSCLILYSRTDMCWLHLWCRTLVLNTETAVSSAILASIYQANCHHMSQGSSQHNVIVSHQTWNLLCFFYVHRTWSRPLMHYVWFTLFISLVYETSQ